jgi:steroid 5-alpha reductase family enzyme
MNIYSPINVIIISLLVTFLISIFKKKNSVMDVAYGATFVLVMLGNFIYMDGLGLQGSLIGILVIVWGVRLASRVYIKNRNKPEDFRYAAWREEWMKKGEVYFYVRSFLQIYVLQGIVISIVALPILVSSGSVYEFNIYNLIGLVLWVIGFLFEAIGDEQLDRFIKSKKSGKATKTNNIMKTGLWKYTRHPNYFGEATMWWGLALLCVGAMAGIGTYAYLIAFLSPLLITFLLVKVSGIPLMEARWDKAGTKEWQTYKAKTSKFIPCFPKK